MTEEQLRIIRENPEAVVRSVARRRFKTFARYMNPKLDVSSFHDVYYEVLDRFAKGRIRRLIVSMPPQHGKLVSDNELVPTPSGMRRHGDLKVGDYVFGRDGKPVMVQWVSPKDKTEYRITFSNGQTIDCHGAHEWVVRDRYINYRERIVETRDLRRLWIGDRGKRGSRVRFHLDSPVCVEYDEREVPIDAYTFGAWLGDGKSSEPLIHIGNNDIEIVNAIPYKAHEQRGTTTRPFYFAEIRESLKPYYNNKHISEEYIYNSVEVRKALVAGLIDSDGSVYKNGRVTISNTNEQVIRACMQILFSLGQFPTLSECAPKVSTSGIVGRRKVYQLSFNPSVDFPTRVPRKKITRLVKQKRIGIVGIERIDGEVGNCIQVEGGVYLVGEHPVLTHNSEGSSRFLPAFLLGLNPDLKIIIGSYSADIAKSFNTDVQRIIKDAKYKSLFPDSYLNEDRQRMNNVYRCNSEISEMVGHNGFVKAVGRSGSLTGRSVDIAILDDLYKDFAEANSGLIREAAWKWYSSVVRTRLHNNSQELIVFTRWHEEDIIGRIEKSGEKIIVARSWSDLEDVDEKSWVLLNFPALKVGEPTELDPREEGEALWEAKHSRESLLAARSLDPVLFECLYQGDPCNDEGRLYGVFKTYVDKSEYGTFLRRGCCIDVADEGTDYLCAICYDIYKSPNNVFNEETHKFEPILYALVTDVLYTQDGTEITNITCPDMVNRNGTQKVWCESNNGGSQFGKNLSKRVRAQVENYYNGANKKARITTNCANVMGSIVFPLGWDSRWKPLYDHLTHFLRTFEANAHDDGADCVTAIYEKEIAKGNARAYRSQTRGIKKRN